MRAKSPTCSKFVKNGVTWLTVACGASHSLCLVLATPKEAFNQADSNRMHKRTPRPVRRGVRRSNDGNRSPVERAQ